MINSKSNDKVRRIRSLAQKKYRDETGTFVVEGARSVQDILAFAPDLVSEVFITEKWQNELSGTLVSDEVFQKISETPSPQGVLAIVTKPDSVPPQCKHILYLDGISDPGNLGTLIRTALAAGYNDIILSGCTDPYAGKVVRSTMSACVKVNLIFGGTDLLSELRAKGYKILGADMCGKNLFCAQKYDKLVLVIGSEARGIASGVQALCDEMLSIPMEGEIESLNAAVSGGIMMYTLKTFK